MQIYLVGNVMADSLLANLGRAKDRRASLHLPDRYGVVTLHRPSNVDDPRVLAGLTGALGELAAECPLIFPVHPRTRPALGDPPPGVTLLEPLGYLDFLALESGASVVLTDSGGVQEETTILSVPCLTLRDSTERPVTVTEGTNTVVGLDPGRIVQEGRRVLHDPPHSTRPALWDGHAGERIARVLRDPGRHNGKRPTSV